MQRDRFSGFNSGFQLLVGASPMLVSVTRNPDEETDDQFVKTHDRFLELDELVKEKLADVKTAEKIQNIGKINGLDLIQTSDIARAIRKYYFGELRKENISSEISRESGVSMEKANAIASTILNQIIGDTSIQDRLEKMTLQEALKKYEKLGEQHLSGNQIKLKIFDSPVRPSIKNWIADYYEKVDARKHDSIERGNYLFHSENARRLTTGERQRVGMMLRALDENSLVAVDPNRQEIMFGNNDEEGEKKEVRGNEVAGTGVEGVKRAEMGVKSEGGMDGMSFSSPHKFPFEQNTNRPTAAPRQVSRPSGNVVNLRDE